MKVVMKFGGAAVKDASGIAQVAKIVKDHSGKGDRIAVVVSAFGGVTDSLVEVMKKIAASKKKSWIPEAIQSLSAVHLSAIKSIGDKEIEREATEAVNGILDELKHVVTGMAHVGEVTPRSRDLLLSFGERLSTPIVAAVLRASGLKTQALTGSEAGITTDDNFGNAEPLMNVTSMQVKQILDPMIGEGVIPVIAGFIAASQTGTTTTLGRGGSDYTAAIIGVSLHADELWFWKEVPGIMTADPTIFPESKLIEKIAFDEAIEIAHFGARVIHPRALEVGLQSNLTYRIKHLWEPEKEGTLIVRSVDTHDEAGATVRAVSIIDRVHLINISGAQLVGTPRVASKVLELLANQEIDVLMISQSSSEANMSLAVPEADADDALNALELSLMGTKLVREITGEGGYCIVAAVGRGMKGTPGVAAKVFQSMAQRKINIRTIAQGSSELNISFMVSRSDIKAAVEAIHKDFRLGEKT